MKVAKKILKNKNLVRNILIIMCGILILLILRNLYLKNKEGFEVPDYVNRLSEEDKFLYYYQDIISGGDGVTDSLAPNYDIRKPPGDQNFNMVSSRPEYNPDINEFTLGAHPFIVFNLGRDQGGTGGTLVTQVFNITPNNLNFMDLSKPKSLEDSNAKTLFKKFYKCFH